SPNGRSAAASPIFRQAPRRPSRPSSPSRTRQSSSLSDGIRCCRSTIASMRGSRPSRTSRSSLYRCLQRHGISRLPETEGAKPSKKKFKTYPIGFFHIDIAEVQTAEGKRYLFVAIDRTSKFAFVRLAEKATRVTASAFLVALIKAVPYKIHTVLTDNGIQF